MSITEVVLPANARDFSLVQTTGSRPSQPASHVVGTGYFLNMAGRLATHPDLVSKLQMFLCSLLLSVSLCVMAVL